MHSWEAETSQSNAIHGSRRPAGYGNYPSRNRRSNYHFDRRRDELDPRRKDDQRCDVKENRHDARRLQLRKVNRAMEEVLDLMRMDVEDRPMLGALTELWNGWQTKMLAGDSDVLVATRPPPWDVFFLFFQAMHQHLWGKPENLKDICLSNESGDRQYLEFGYYIEHYRLPALPGPLKLCDGKIYIRECYKKLRGIQRNRIILTGTPGIGKSVYLWYHLVHRMLEAKPCVWVMSSVSFVIDENGVKTFTGPNTYFYPDAWMYLDYEQAMADAIPYHFFGNRQTVAGAIMSTPPIEDRWWSLDQEGDWVELLMPPWDNLELLFTARMIYGTNRATDEYISTLIRKFGTAPQTIFLILSNRSTEDEEWDDIARALPTRADYAGIFNDFHRRGAMREGADLGYHRLFELSPRSQNLENTSSSPDFPRYYWCVVGLRSRDVLKACVAIHQTLEHKAAVQQYRNLHSLKKFADLAGSMSGLLAQTRLSCGGTFSSYTLRPYEENKRSITPSTGFDLSLYRPKPDSQEVVHRRIAGRHVRDTQLSPAGEVFEIFALSDIFARFSDYPNCDYIGKLQVPCVDKWPGLVSFAVTAEGRVVLFQCTTGEPRPVKTSELDLLQGLLPTCLHPKKDRKWIFNFVTPMSTTHEALAIQRLESEPPNSNIQKDDGAIRGAAVAKWTDFLEQRWLPLDDDRLFSG